MYSSSDTLLLAASVSNLHTHKTRFSISVLIQVAIELQQPENLCKLENKLIPYCIDKTYAGDLFDTTLGCNKGTVL